MSRMVGFTRELLPSLGTADDAAALSSAGATTVIDEPSTPGFDGRGRIDQLTDHLRVGDVVLITEAARLASSVAEFTSTVTVLTSRGVRLRVLSEPALSTGDGTYDPAEVIAALHALRLRLIGLRTRAGMEVAAAAGRRIGRPPVMTEHRLDIARELRGQHRSYAHIARVLGVSPSAVQRALSDPTSPEPTPSMTRQR